MTRSRNRGESTQKSERDKAIRCYARLGYKHLIINIMNIARDIYPQLYSHQPSNESMAKDHVTTFLFRSNKACVARIT